MRDDPAGGQDGPVRQDDPTPIRDGEPVRDGDTPVRDEDAPVRDEGPVQDPPVVRDGDDQNLVPPIVPPAHGEDAGGPPPDDNARYQQELLLLALVDLEAAGYTDIVERVLAMSDDLPAAMAYAESALRVMRGEDGRIDTNDGPDSQAIREANDLSAGDLRQRLIDAHGIGPVLADRILAEREANGPFTSLQNLMDRVQGIGPVRADIVAAALSGRTELHNHQGGVYTVQDVVSALGHNAGEGATPLEQRQMLHETLQNVRSFQELVSQIMADRGLRRQDAVRWIRENAGTLALPEGVSALLRLNDQALGGLQLPDSVLRVLENPPEGADLAWFDNQLTLMLTAGVVPFNDAYQVRRVLFGAQQSNSIDSVRIMLQRLKSQGADYVELQGGMSPNVPPSVLARLCQEIGIEVRFLAYISSRDVLGTTTEGTGPQTATHRAIDQMFDAANGGFVVGVDYAGPEQGFTQAGTDHFVEACLYMESRLSEHGGSGVMRVHVGEGYFANATTPDARAQAETQAQQNVEAIIRAIEQFQSQRSGQGDVQIRLGHVTHATEAQIRRLAELGVHVEVNLGSNLATGAIEALDQHPLLAMLYHGVDLSINTDAGGVMRTDLDNEYQLAGQIIDRFRNGEISLVIDGQPVLWQDLPDDVRERFSVAYLEQQSRQHGRIGRTRDE